RAARWRQQPAGQVEGACMPGEDRPAPVLDVGCARGAERIHHAALRPLRLASGTSSRSAADNVGITCSRTLAEDSTPGTPAPGCVPAPTKYRPFTSSERLW